jgi:hypothetical protein
MLCVRHDVWQRSCAQSRPSCPTIWDTMKHEVFSHSALENNGLLLLGGQDDVVFPRTPSPGSCGFFIYLRPAKIVKFRGTNQGNRDWVVTRHLRDHESRRALARSRPGGVNRDRSDPRQVAGTEKLELTQRDLHKTPFFMVVGICHHRKKEMSDKERAPFCTAPCLIPSPPHPTSSFFHQ